LGRGKRPHIPYNRYESSEEEEYGTNSQSRKHEKIKSKL